MRVLFVADGRSPIALNWMRYFVEQGEEVFLASTFSCSPGIAFKDVEITPVAFSGSRPRASSGQIAAGSARWRTAVRDLLGPLTVRRSAQRLRQYADRIQPDLIHAMRIPFEGMLAADAYGAAPLLVSAWGNDFTLHARSSALIRHYTEWTLQVADAFHADCRRDLRLARMWGFDPQKPTLLAPGAGGINTNVFFPPTAPDERPTVVNPRGSRAYIRNDVFFKAIPLVLARIPDARFLCAALSGDRDAARWVTELGLQDSVELLPQLSQSDLADVFRRSRVVVSPSTHDGTPNSLLEAMACGCFPVAGDLESIREWIKSGENGLLVDATDPGALAGAILRALQDEDLRRDAAGLNQNMITERADYSRCMSGARDLYRRLIASRSPSA